jgi:hypothetical protein
MFPTDQMRILILRFLPPADRPKRKECSQLAGRLRSPKTRICRMLSITRCDQRNLLYENFAVPGGEGSDSGYDRHSIKTTSMQNICQQFFALFNAEWKKIIHPERARAFRLIEGAKFKGIFTSASPQRRKPPSVQTRAIITIAPTISSSIP